MIIDCILDRKAFIEDGIDNYSIDRHGKYMYDEAMMFERYDLASALDCGNNEDVQHELCKYVIGSGYNPELCNFIKSVCWV